MIFIYTCKARLNAALQVYDMLWNVNEKKYIVYGDTLEEEYRLTDKCLILNVGDYYENLSEKTKKMFQVAEKLFPDEPVLKMDDDIIPNTQLLQESLKSLKEVDYGGMSCTNNREYESIHHIGKVHDPIYNIPMHVPRVYGVAGPMYYLSVHAIRTLNRSERNCFYEDVMVGHCLNEKSIFPTNIILYHDEDITSTYHNHSNHKKLYVKLHGGLGNQLFQVASGYGIAKKHNFILILVSDFKTSSFPHQEELDTYIRHFFNTFHLIHQGQLPSMPHYYEMDNVKCFQYNEMEVDKTFYIEGYLQTEKYFKEYRKEIVDMFKPYNLRLSSYFIHVRRGDYSNNPLYQMDDNYYKKAIDYMESLSKNHYYIVSDDITYCKECGLFDSLNKSFVNDTAINTLAIMSSCKGGICANSSFSWWGSYLIDDPEKIVIFPKTWIHNGHDNLDIYYEGSIIL
jgi:hypothetical protein